MHGISLSKPQISLMIEILRSFGRFCGESVTVDSLEDPLHIVSGELLLAVSC